jgi:hypothetical protein
MKFKLLIVAFQDITTVVINTSSLLDDHKYSFPVIKVSKSCLDSHTTNAIEGIL